MSRFFIRLSLFAALASAVSAVSATSPASSPETTTTLTVIDSAGRSMVGVMVAVTARPAEVRTTDEQGRVFLPITAAGSEADETGGLELRLLPPGSVEPVVTRVEPGPDGARVALPDSATLGRRQFVVRGPAPAAGTRVEVWVGETGAGDPGAYWATAVADTEGRFDLFGAFQQPVRLRLRPAAGAAGSSPLRLAERVIPPTPPGTETGAPGPLELPVVTAPSPATGAGSHPGLVADLAPGFPLYGRILGQTGDDERPLEGARVALIEPGDDPAPWFEPATGPPPTGTISPPTDAEGWFAVPPVALSAFDLHARAEGFAPATLRRMDRPTTTRAVDLGTLILLPGERIAGRVVDSVGRPVDGAEIRLRAARGRPGPGDDRRLAERRPSAVAGADGRFTLVDLAGDRPVDLHASAPGHVAAWTLAVDVPPAEPVELILEPASRLTGRVVDEADRPVAGVRVTLRWRGPPAGTVGVEPPRRQGSRETVSESDGAFRFDELAPGRIEVEAIADDYLPVSPVTAELLAGEATGPLRLELRRGSELSGTVRDERGEPVADAALRLGAQRTRSGADGSYRLAGLVAGNSGLFTYHPGFRPQAQEVLVEAGLNRADVVLEDGLSVGGRTVGPDGEPVAGARLTLRREGPRPSRGFQATSGPDGAFRMVVDEPASYRLVAARTGFAPRVVEGIRVGRESVENLDVVLGRGAELVGYVLGLDLDDLATVEVEATLPGMGEVVGAVRFDGGYRVSHLVPGDWEVVARVAGGRRETRAVVTVPPGAERVERDLDLGGGFVLTGLLRHDGEPISAAHVVLEGRDLSARRSVATGHDGRFRIEDLDAGLYRIDILDPNRALSHVEDLEVTGDQYLPVDLSSVTLNGRVVEEETDEPLFEALVTVRKIFGPGDAGSLITTGTAPDGGFTIAHLPPGSYLVGAGKDGYTPVEERLEIEAGGPRRDPVLRLGRAGGLTLYPRFASGALPGMITVSAFDEGGQRALTTTRVVTEGGFAQVERIAPGTWDLLLSSPGAAPQWQRATVPGSLDVTFAPAAPLTVRVPDLMAVGGAGTLLVSAADGTPFTQVEPAGTRRSQWPVDGGLTRLDDVPAGVWTLQVTAADGTVWAGRVVTDGQNPAEATLE